MPPRVYAIALDDGFTAPELVLDYGGQYAQTAPLFEHYGIQLWTPEARGPVDFQAAGHELLMLAMGLAFRGRQAAAWRL